MDKEKHRLFIAITLDEALRQKIKTIIKPCQQRFHAKHIHWVALENYHITLAFLGIVEAEKIALIGSALTEIHSKLKPFTIEIDSLMLFPSSEHPKILAAKVPLTVELGELYASIKQAMVKLGFEPDNRPYVPHLTLAKIKQPWQPPKSIEKFISHFSELKICITNTAPLLFESLQTPEGTKYNILKGLFSGHNI